MRIGHISFRLAGTDGVSLETAKIAAVLARHGHQNFYFAGELDAPNQAHRLLMPPLAGQVCVPAAHFTHPEAVWITSQAFGNSQAHPQLYERIESLAQELSTALLGFIQDFDLQMLTIQNVFAIPLHLPLSIALMRVIQSSGIHAIAHHHDFYWEREAYRINCVADILQTCFPPRLPTLRHLVINSQAQRALKNMGIQSSVLPNIFDFDMPVPPADAYNADLRAEMGLAEEDLFFLQPTRVIPRKGIELAIELAHQLNDLPIKLIITHPAEHNSQDYLAAMLALADHKKVHLRYAPQRFNPERATAKDGRKIYSLWDAYIHADFVTYPSLYEGFGNALLETIFFRKALVNRYSIYQQDIEPTGLDAIVIDGKITDQALTAVREILVSPQRRAQMTQHNLEVARKHFSYATAWERLQAVLLSFPH